MPIKVSCPSCQRSINAPDRARGKAVKCPECGQVVRVPAASLPKKVAAPPPPSSSMLIAAIDLDRIEDTENRICPKCGAEVSPEDIECPECFVNLETGTLSAEKKAELSRKGPNPKLYYREFFSNGIEFWKKNKKVALRLTWLAILFTLIFCGCMFASIWLIKPFVRYFFVFLGVIALLIPPGLAWNLHTVIIDATMRKKKKLPKYHFDKFLGAALGLKLIFWFLVIALPFHVVAAVFVFLGTRDLHYGFLIAGAVEGIAVLFTSLLFPIAMTHMAMPITTRGWLVNKMFRPLLRTLPGVFYWCFFTYLSLVPPLLCIAAGAYFSAKHIQTLYEAAEHNTKLYETRTEMEDMPKNAVVTPVMKWAQTAKYEKPSYIPLILPAALLTVAAGLFGAASFFSMRTNGLFGYYFLNRLDLETLAPEIKYVPAAANLGEMEGRKLTLQPVLLAMGALFAASVTVGGTLGKSYLSGFKEGALKGMMLAGGLSLAVGLVWLLVAVTKHKEFKWESAQFGTVLAGSGAVYSLLGVGLYFLL